MNLFYSRGAHHPLGPPSKKKTLESKDFTDPKGLSNNLYLIIFDV